MLHNHNIDVTEVAKCVKKILTCTTGDDCLPASMEETPLRVAKLYQELFGNKPDPVTYIKLFEAVQNELVCKFNIEYYSMCEHHLVPFFGIAHIGYVPNGKILGISKLKRIVDHFAHWPNTQEHLTTAIANFLYNRDPTKSEPPFKHEFQPQGVIVIMEGTHLCEIMRGARNCQDSKMITSAIRGKFHEEAALKEEFMQMLNLR